VATDHFQDTGPETVWIKKARRENEQIFQGKAQKEDFYCRDSILCGFLHHGFLYMAAGIAGNLKNNPLTG
jgi:hypothetical protein